MVASSGGGSAVGPGSRCSSPPTRLPVPHSPPIPCLASAVMPRIPRRLDAFVAECAPLLSRLAEQDPAGPVPPALVGVVEAIQAEWGKEGGQAWERVGDELSALSLRILVGRAADRRGGG